MDEKLMLLGLISQMEESDQKIVNDGMAALNEVIEKIEDDHHKILIVGLFGTDFMEKHG